MVRKKLFGIFSGALVGYMWGWIWGWSLFDPNSDMWALLAAVLGLAGLAAGMLPFFWRRAGSLFGATLGLYLGWTLRTLVFRDVPGGPGVIMMLAGVLSGGWIGARKAFVDGSQGLHILVGALYIGFFGGFLVDVVLLDLVLGWVKTHSILGQAPMVIACGILGGGLVAWLETRKRKI